MEGLGAWLHAGALAADIVAEVAAARGMGKAATEAAASLEESMRIAREAFAAHPGGRGRKRGMCAPKLEDGAAHGSTILPSTIRIGSRRPPYTACTSSMRAHSGEPAIGAMMTALDRLAAIGA